MSIKKIITTLYTSLFIVLLFANLPIVEDKFNLGTYSVVFAFSAAINLLYALDLTKKKKFLIKIPRSYILIINIFVLASLGINYLTSSNQFFSLWGDQNGFTSSLVPMAICFTLILPFVHYFNSLESIIDLLYLTSIGISAKSVFFIVILILHNADQSAPLLTENLEFYNHLFWVILAQIVLVYKSKKLSLKEPWNALLITINTIFLFFAVEPLSAILLTMVSTVAFFSIFYDKKSNKFLLKNAQITLMSFVILASLVSFAVPRQYKYEGNLLKRLDFGNSINISLTALADRPLFGTGKGTFPDAFGENRPENLNKTDDWDKLFTMPYSQFNLDLTELGLLTTGLLIVLFVFALKIINSNLDLKDDRAKFVFVTTLLLISSYFLLIWSIQIFLLALLIIASLSHFESKDETKVLWPAIMLIILIGLGGGGYHLYKCVKADYYYHLSQQAIESNNTAAAYKNLIKAKNTLKNKAEYRSEFAQLSLIIGEELFEKTKGTENEVEPLFAQSVREIKYTSEVLAPKSTHYWVIKAVIYSKLESKYAGASNNVIETYKTLVFLSPSQPLFRYKLAEGYYNQGNYEKAIVSYDATLALKDNYSLAKIGKAKTLLQIGETNKAQDILITIANDAKEDSSIRNQAIEILKQTPKDTK